MTAKNIPEFSIIIVGQNVRWLIRQCLESIYNQSFRDFEVVFVDNNSNDGTKEFIRSYYPEVTLLENKENLGFCAATNQGIEVSKGRFVCTLNCDVILDKDFLLNIFNGLKGLDRRIGMATGKILRFDRKRIDSTGIILTRLRRFYDRGSNELSDDRYNKPERVFGPCAAAGVYKKDMLDDLKIDGEYFDRDFFFSVEDIDIAWRANNKGWECVYLPEAICYHLRQSRYYKKDFMQYYAFRNRYLMLIKNEELNPFIIISFFIYDIPRFFYTVFKNRKIWMAIFEVLVLFPKMLEKRKIINRYKKSIIEKSYSQSYLIS